MADGNDIPEHLKAMGTLKPFDPNADCIHSMSRIAKRASPDKNPDMPPPVADHDHQTPPSAIITDQQAQSNSPLQVPNPTQPRPFPTISPPQTPMVLDVHETTPDPESDGEMLPTIEKMLADTRPDYTASQMSPATPRPATKVEALSPTDAASFSLHPKPRPKPKSKSTIPSRARGTGVPPSPSASVIEILSSPGSPTPAQKGTKRKHDSNSHDTEHPLTPKRARRLTGTGKGKRRFTKHETHWYLDGSVLVQIKSVQFKLHRSRLNKLSRWFEEQFERDANDEQDDDELPIYYLDETGITVKDFEVLLDAMDDAMYVHIISFV